MVPLGGVVVETDLLFMGNYLMWGQEGGVSVEPWWCTVTLDNGILALTHTEHYT